MSADVDSKPMHSRSEHPMLDVVMLAIGLVFFALSLGYTIACDRL
jgi:SNF family Na+-dependent transporter